MNIQLNMIGFVCEDIDASLKFYRILGIEVPSGAGKEDHVETTLPGGLRLAWDRVELVKQLDPNWKKPVGQGIGLAFLCDSADGVDETYHKLVEAGFASHKEPWDAFWGQRYAQVCDPDGYVIDLFAWL